MGTREIRNMISTATIGDGDQVLNILEKVCDELDKTEHRYTAMRLAVGSLLDLNIEIAEVVGGDEDWKELARGVLRNHKTELGFID